MIALKNLVQDKGRFALSVAGVALAIMLVLLLDGMLAGMFRQISSYLEHTEGELVVAQEGVTNLLGATSVLPSGTSAWVDGIRGVRRVVPILSQFVILDLHDKKQAVYLVGYEPDRGGGPWEISQGREPRSNREVVFDRILAQRHDLGLGDQVEVMDRTFRIVGISEGTASWMTSFIFVRKAAVEDLLGIPQATSFLLVSTDGRHAGEQVRQRIARIDDVEVLSKQEMAANDIRLFAQYFSAPVRLMAGIAFLVGVLVVGLIVYTATVERQREYGVLKALGAPNRLLYRVVLTQAALAAIPGSILGIGLSQAASALVMALRPQFLVVIQAGMTGRALAVGLGMALLAAVVPARVVARVAPAEVFRK